MAGFMGGLFGTGDEIEKNQKEKKEVVAETESVKGADAKLMLHVNDNTETHFHAGVNPDMIEMQVENPLSKDYGILDENITYGELIRTTYYSNTCEKERNLIVLLPPGYSKQKKYPVCYVLHGIFGDETSMIGDGQTGTRIVAGNLMTSGQAKEMIMVFPYMFASKTMDSCSEISIENILAYDNFINDLEQDLMPYMEANYSIAVGKENTAICGFSLGGRESLAIGLMRPELFGYVGAIAPAPGLVPGKDWAMEHPGQMQESDLTFEGKKNPYFLFVCCGSIDSVVGKFPESYHCIFEKNGVEHYWWEIEGSDHADPAITNGLVNFWKNIFKK